MPEQSIEDRLTYLESKIAEYEAERTQARAIQGLRTDITELRAVFHAHEEYVTDRLNNFENNLTTQIKTVETDVKSLKEDIGTIKEGQQALAASQGQILAILTGKAKTND